MKHLLLFLFASLISHSGWAQTQSFKKLYKKAKTEVSKENYPAAEMLLEQALQQRPKHYEAIRLYGKTLYNLKKYQAASEKYSLAVSILKSEPENYVSLADCYLHLHDYPKAEETYTRLINEKPKFLPGHYKRAFALIRQGKYKEAIKDCDDALKKDHILAPAYYYKGLAQDSLKDYPAARLNYEKAIHLIETNEAYEKRTQPGYEPYYFNMARAYNELGLFDKSLEFYAKALKLDPADKADPADYLLYFCRAKTYLNKKEYSLALSDLNKALAIKHDYREAFVLRGNIYLLTSQYQSAISDYTKAILFHQSYPLFCNRAKCYYELAEFTSALNDYKTALSLNPAADSINGLITLTNSRLYDKNKESQPPLIKVTMPVADAQGYINISLEQEETLFEGEVFDQSQIKRINVNGEPALFYRDALNPKFSVKVKNTNTDKIKVEAFDIYDNRSEMEYKVGKVLSDARLRYEFTGKILLPEQQDKPLTDMVVYLLNKKGERIATAKTNEKGVFQFNKLPYDKNELTLMIDSTDARLENITKLVVAEKNTSAPVITMEKLRGKVFAYSVLPYEANMLNLMEVDEAPLNQDLKGKLINGDDMKTPIAFYTIHLVNEKGVIIDSKKTDAFGAFLFARMPRAQKYSIKLDQKESAKLDCKKIILTDNSGKVIKEFDKNTLGEFMFEVLPADEYYLASVTEEDPYMRVFNLGKKKKELDIIENVYYESGKWEVLPEAQLTIQKLVAVLKANPKVAVVIEAHTDAQAGDDYNMELSMKRANTVVDFITAAGVDKKRVTGVGYGETRLINKCANGIDCSDAEHKQNRRTVFKLKYTE